MTLLRMKALWHPRRFLRCCGRFDVLSFLDGVIYVCLLMPPFLPAGIQAGRERRAGSSQGPDRAPDKSVLNQRETSIRRPIKCGDHLSSISFGLSRCSVLCLFGFRWNISVYAFGISRWQLCISRWSLLVRLLYPFSFLKHTHTKKCWIQSFLSESRITAIYCMLLLVLDGFGPDLG